MNLRQLEYFIHVAELGSFTQAALILGIGQPTLSRQVRQLEVELRQALFYRNGRGVQLTEAGKRLLAHGRTIQIQFEHARHDVEDTRGSPVGRVTVGFPYAVGRRISVPFVQAFQQRFPNATLCLTEGLTIHLYEWLLSGRIDIALLHDPTPSPNVDIHPLHEDSLFLLRRKRHAQDDVNGDPIPLRQIAEMPLIMPCRPHSLRMLVETHLANLGLKPNIVLEVDAVAVILELVAKDIGCAIATTRPVALCSAQDDLQLHPIVSPHLSSILALATSAERPLTTLVQKTSALLRELVPNDRL